MPALLLTLWARCWFTDILYKLYLRAPYANVVHVAEWIRRLTYSVRVPGSIPTQSAFFFVIFLFFGIFFSTSLIIHAAYIYAHRAQRVKKYPFRIRLERWL